MACNLTRDPTGDFEFLTTTVPQTTVFVESDSGTIHLTAATLNGAPLTVTADKTTFKAAVGRNTLDLAFAGADPDEEFRIKEDCGGGNSQLMTTWRLRPSDTQPGDPTRAFRIKAT